MQNKSSDTESRKMLLIRFYCSLHQFSASPDIQWHNVCISLKTLRMPFEC